MTSLPSEPSVIRIASRQSPLAIWQSNYVKLRLQQIYPDMKVEIIGLKTRGDKILDVTLSKVGGKGLFVKELEHALLNGIADIAVHSMKDVPMEFPQGLGLQVICEREDPTDAFVSNQYAALEDLPEGSCVGTSSLRRKTQLLEAFPNLEVTDLRGNVNTRLNKLLVYLNHSASQKCITAERSMNRYLRGGCETPVAAYAILTGQKLDRMWLRGLIGSPDGSQVIRADIEGTADNAELLGIDLAKKLLKQGAGDILKKVYGDNW